MSDTVATPDISTPGVAPVTVPPADQPPEKAREKTFYDRFDAKAAELGGLNDDDDEEAETPPATPAVPEPDKKPPPAAAKPEDDKVTVGERAQFREAKEKHERWYREKQAELEKREKELTSTHGERVSKAESILKAIEDGDPEGFAKAVGTKDFNEFQESFIKRLADPNYKELRALQLKLAEREAREEQQKKEQEQQEQQRQRAEVQTRWLSDLTEKGKVSKDRVAQAMADEPLFLNSVFQIQKAHWNSSEGTTVSLEEALDRGLPGQKTTLREVLRGLYERLGKAFGEPPALAAANGRKPAPKTAVTPSRTTDAAGGKGRIDPLSPEWREYRQRRMAEAKDD